MDNFFSLPDLLEQTMAQQERGMVNSLLLTFAMREKLQLLFASYDVKKKAATLEETMNVNKQRSCDRYPMSLCLSTSRSRIADQQEIKYGVTLWRC